MTHGAVIDTPIGPNVPKKNRGLKLRDAKRMNVKNLSETQNYTDP